MPFPRRLPCPGQISNGMKQKKRLRCFLSCYRNCWPPCARPSLWQEAIAQFAQSRVLCALREGPWGVAGINARCRELLQRQGQIPARDEVYQGLPILILRNDYTQGLYNGDTGIIWPNKEGQLTAWFAGEDGLRSLRSSHPSTLAASLCHDRAQGPGRGVCHCASGVSRGRPSPAQPGVALHLPSPGQKNGSFLLLDKSCSTPSCPTAQPPLWPGATPAPAYTFCWCAC